MDRQVKGILGAKLGMTQVWDNNKVVPVTVVQAGPCVVTQVRTADKDGYSAVQLAYGAIDPRKVNKPKAGHFAKAGVAPRRHIVELRTTDAGEYTLGQEVTVDDVRGRSADRRHRQDQGQGLRRRHEAARLPRSEGQPRRRAQAPLARLDRRLRDPGPRLQGRADGRPHGRRALHRAGPDRPGGRHRAEPDPGPGRDPRPQGRAGAGPHRGEGARRRRAVRASDHR